MRSIHGSTVDITGELGSGTFGVVHEAEVKSKPQDETAVQRAIRDCLDLARKIKQQPEMRTIIDSLGGAMHLNVCTRRSVALKTALVEASIVRESDGLALGSASGWESLTCLRESDSLVLGRQLYGCTISSVFAPFATGAPKPASLSAVASWSSTAAPVTSLLSGGVSREMRLAVHMATEKFACSLCDVIQLARRLYPAGSDSRLLEVGSSMGEAKVRRSRVSRISRARPVSPLPTMHRSQGPIGQVAVTGQPPGASAAEVLASILSTEIGKRAIATQALGALATLHQKGLCHRDIKSNNILLSVQNVGTPHEPMLVPHLVLADLGTLKQTGKAAGGVLSSAVPRGSSPPTKHCCFIAHRHYRAPELLLGSTSYGVEADVFSLGAVLAELWLQAPLFSESKSAPGQAPDKEPDTVHGDAVQLVVRSTLLGVPSDDESKELCGMLEPPLADGARSFFKHCSLHAPSPAPLPPVFASSSSSSSGTPTAGSQVPAGVPTSSLLTDYFRRCDVPRDVSHCLASMLAWSPGKRAAAGMMLLHPAWRLQV